ncbi:MAG TPA: hypothetical protein VHW01_29795 [Polyangiaceae bacterium]|nr:hypothetical protein [Polyangiaceae bacterium]
MRTGVYLTAVAAPVLGCSTLLSSATLSDSAPPASIYVAEAKPAKPCDPPVELVHSQEEAHGPYLEVASLSATCYPGTPELCERVLLQHACEHQADAVILVPAQAGATPAGNPQPQISMSGRAVRWTKP